MKFTEALKHMIENGGVIRHAQYGSWVGSAIDTPDGLKMDILSVDDNHAPILADGLMLTSGEWAAVAIDSETETNTETNTETEQ